MALCVFRYPELEWGAMPANTPTDYQNFLKVWEIVTAFACLYVGFMVSDSVLPCPWWSQKKAKSHEVMFIRLSHSACTVSILITIV